jgi:hypothetical protein
VFVRYLGLDGNPLRRAVDRVDSWATVALLLVLLVGGPLVTWHAGALAGRGGPARSFTVQAVLDEDAVAAPAVGEFAMQSRVLAARARWTGPDGVPRAGRIELSSVGRAGSTVEILTDGAGNPIPPIQEEQRVGRVFLAGLLSLLGLVCVLVFARLALNRVLDRWRLAYWRQEWTVTEPRWSGRR